MGIHRNQNNEFVKEKVIDALYNEKLNKIKPCNKYTAKWWHQFICNKNDKIDYVGTYIQYHHPVNIRFQVIGVAIKKKSSSTKILKNETGNAV